MAKDLPFASITKAGPGFFKTDIDGNSRLVRQLFSVAGVIDSYGDRIHLGAFKKTLKERFDRVQVLWQHNLFDPPIGVLVNAKEIGKDELPPELKKAYPEATGALEGEVEYLETPRGEEVLQGIRKRALKENSIGLDAVKVEFTDEPQGKVSFKIRELLEVRLWDVSPVNWGANPATMNVKGAVPFKSTGADKSTPWTKPALADFGTGLWDDLDDGEKKRIAAHFGWAGGMPPESFGECKLPHHTPTRNGIGPANWSGVKAAMLKLMQAATDVQDLESVYTHLAKHYRDDFGEEPPDFKLVELAYSVRAAVVLGPENLYGCFDALESLNAALKRAEPQVLGYLPDVQALTLSMERIRLLKQRIG